MKTEYTPLISLLGTGTLILDIAIVLGIFLFLASARVSAKSWLGKSSRFIGNNSMAIGFLIAVAATVSSLFLSEVVLFVPCKLCWYQRILMYPQVVILGIGLFLNDKRAKLYALVLSIVGLLVAVYHILLQFWPGIFPCSDEIANCALKQFEYFGYITIPVMSATTFAALILVLVFGMKKSR